MEEDLARPDPGDGLGDAELAGETVDALPERQAMSTINVGIELPVDNFAMPINEATAVNIQSSNSMAVADADQIIALDQIDTGDDTSEGGRA